MADETGVQRLMARAAAGNQRHLAGLEVASAHEFVTLAEGDDVGVRGTKTVEAFGQDSVDLVDQLLHALPPASDPAPA